MQDPDEDSGQQVIVSFSSRKYHRFFNCVVLVLLALKLDPRHLSFMHPKQ